DDPVRLVTEEVEVALLRHAHRPELLCRPPPLLGLAGGAQELQAVDLADRVDQRQRGYAVLRELATVGADALRLEVGRLALGQQLRPDLRRGGRGSRRCLGALALDSLAVLGQAALERGRLLGGERVTLRQLHLPAVRVVPAPD